MTIFHDRQVLWFLNRGTGVVLLVLMTASVTLGVLATLRASSKWWPRFVTQALHRNISLLALALLATHAGLAIVDSYVNIRWYDAFIPFDQKYRPLWGAFGTVALDLIVLSTVTGLLRHRFGRRHWRVIHLSTYVAWLFGLIHGLGIGTDRRTTWSAVTTACCIGVVAGACALRLATFGHERKREKVPV